jgi:DNA-binding MarR family transcriptional regulator
LPELAARIRAEREATSAALQSGVEHGIVNTIRGPAGRRI